MRTVVQAHNQDFEKGGRGRTKISSFFFYQNVSIGRHAEQTGEKQRRGQGAEFPAIGNHGSLGVMKSPATGRFL